HGEFRRRRVGRDKMRAVVHRPHIDAVRRQVKRNRVARIVDRYLAVHVGAGEIEHHDTRVHRCRRSARNSMEPDTIEWRWPALSDEMPFVDSWRALELARRADLCECLRRW